ncbi:hypothetical protein IQ225_18230 [Synechocystis salina LEGE 06155]|nr:hypothetical protein [Synechocystis salina LEGE 06155]
MEIRRMKRKGIILFLHEKKSHKRNVPAVFYLQLTTKRYRNKDGSMGEFNTKIKEAKDEFKKKYSDLWWKQKSQDEGGYLYIEPDPELYEFLKHIGFLGFHETNHGEIIYKHQLIKYLFGNGHKLYANGYYARKGEVEIHHLDNDPTNNEVDNLKYVSPQLNRYCSESLFLTYYGDPSETSSKIPEGQKEAEKMLYLTLERYLKRYGVYCNDRPKLEELLKMFHHYGREYITSRLGQSPNPLFLDTLRDFASDELTAEDVVKKLDTDFSTFDL